MKFFQPVENKVNLEQCKRVEKEKLDKPQDRPVEPIDHDERRKKFQEVSSKKELPKEKKVAKDEKVKEKSEHPSIFQYAFKHSHSDEEPEQEKEEETIKRIGSPYGVRQQPIEAVFGKSEEVVGSIQAELIEVIEQMVRAIEVQSKSDRVETTVTLQHPPLFKGVSFTMTELETSPGELNLAFHNLTNPDARALVEQPHSIEMLRANLIEKGYMLQMVTIEPKLDLNIVAVELDLKSNSEDDSQPQDEPKHR